MKAWEIANDKGVKTINGYSGNYPDGWGLEYLSRVNNMGRALCWISQNRLEHVYIYDMIEKKWISSDDAELSYTTWTEELYLDGGEISKEGYILHPGGVQFGPYLSLPEGRYTISIYGENLQNVQYDCGAPDYDGASAEELVHNGDMIQYVIDLEKETDEIEFRTYNFTENECIINKITITPYRG